MPETLSRFIRFLIIAQICEEATDGCTGAFGGVVCGGRREFIRECSTFAFLVRMEKRGSGEM